MNKKTRTTCILKIISAFLSVMLLLASCGNAAKEETAATGTAASDHTHTPDQSITSAQSGTQSPTQTDTASLTTTGTTVPDLRTETDTKGLYLLKSEKNTEYAPEFSAYGDLLIYRHGGKLKLIDITNGNELNTADVTEEYFRFGLISDGYYTITGNEVTCFSTDGSVVRQVALPVNDPWSVNVLPDGRRILYNSAEGVYIKDLCNGTDVKADTGISVSVVCDYRDDRFVITDFNSDMYYLFFDGKTEKINKRKSSYVMNGMLIETNYEGHTVTRIGSENTTIIYGDYENEYIEAADERYFIAWGPEDMCRLYDTAGSRSTDRIFLGETHDIKACGNGLFAVLEYLEDGYEFYALSASEAEYITELNVSDDYVFPENYVRYFKDPEGDEELLKLVNEIYDTYGVRVFFEMREETEGKLFDYSYKDFTGDKKRVLNEFAAFLKLSPEGIWREIRDGNDCYVYFCDEINEADGAYVDAAGLTMDIGENPAITVESVYNYFIDLFSHEFIHLIEKKVGYKALDKWEELSPEGSYFMSFKDYNTRKDAFEMTSLGNGKKAYFIDNYSRTFPTEDRARIGEYLYSSYKNGGLVWQFEESKYLRKKAKALCEMFREAYPCLESVPQGKWYLEKYLY